ncbi:hypothetical protein LR004_00840 [Candidatus Gracilibacteria bacterium]|nr:hypothetical protein [Candidatus Gracilibacteria bacterium]
MNLFINAVSSSGALILFDNSKNIISKQAIQVLGNESSKLVTVIEDFLSNNNHTYSDIENIVVVNGPGSFTGVRTIVLAINTINYIIKKNITQLSFFDLFTNYPIIKSSSRRDLFVKYEINATIDIVKNEDFLEKVQNNSASDVFGDISNNSISDTLSVDSNIDYSSVINNLEFQNNKIIEPLYIKKPNIS